VNSYGAVFVVRCCAGTTDWWKYPPCHVMQIIGLTGGIGTGKSTACKILKEIEPKIIIIDADILSHEATKPGKLPFLLLKHLILPKDCFNLETGELIRSRLAELIFAPNKRSRALKKIVERCIHPWIIWKICLRIVWFWFKGEARIVLDVPLLFEAKLQWICTRALLIDTTRPEVQLKRILKRNPEMTEEEAKNRIASQFPMEMKRKLADHVINNDGSLIELKKALEIEFKKPDIFKQRLIYLYLPILVTTIITVTLTITVLFQ
jgi:dephospho-CoA kinase